MVCIISCNNPVQAARRRLNSSNRASDQAQMQRQARAGCCGWQKLTSPAPLGGGQPWTPLLPGTQARGSFHPALGDALGYMWFCCWGTIRPPTHAAVVVAHTSSTLRSLPKDAKEGQAQRETPHSHLQTSLINDWDRETQTGAGGIDKGRRMPRAAKPRDIPRQNGHSPLAYTRGTQTGWGQNWAQEFKTHLGIRIKALLNTPPIPSHRWGSREQ